MCNSNSRSNYGFITTVQSEFSYLSTVGFKCVKETSTFVRFESVDLFVNVYHGASSHEIGAEVGKLGPDGDIDKYSVSELIRITDSDEAKKYRNFTATSPEAVVTGVKRLSAIFGRYAGPFLNGDTQLFRKLEHQKREWSKKFSLEILSKQVRPKAEEAFRDKRYGEALTLYESIESELSPAEHKRLNYCRKHV
jgi:hypothetical protein